MSMKFFTGLQDLLGLYENGTSSSSPASPIPPTMYSQSHSAANTVRKKVSDANKETKEERIRHCSHNRNVTFPEDDSIITGYHEPQISKFHSGEFEQFVNIDKIGEDYRDACKRRNCYPSVNVEKQIKCFHKCPQTRQEILSLKGERVSHSQMEALEEIFKSVQFNMVDFEYTFLDDDGAITLAEIIEYYDSCVRLNLSFNKQIDVRGWTAIFRAVKNSTSLQMLNLRYTTLSDKSLPALCKTLRAKPATTLRYLHLENTDMSGKNLLILISALKSNTGIKELYLGDNGLHGTDGAHLFQLIQHNKGIQLLDLRNNHLGDSGLRHICDALKNRETLANSTLSAIVLWNNRITASSMDCLADALLVNTKIETLNIGNNKIGHEGVSKLKPAVVSNENLHRLGLQNTGVDCLSAIILAECIADNTALLRVDVRDNPIALAGLLALHSAMKMNKSITLFDIDSNCVKLSTEKVPEYQDEFERYFKEIRGYCERNKQDMMNKMKVTLEDQRDEQTKAEDNKSENKIPTIKKEDEKQSVKVDPTLTPNNENVSATVISFDNEKRFRSKSCGTPEKHHQKFTRSSSLTCSETVHDINDRIREMSGSTHSLDAATGKTLSSSPLDANRNLKPKKSFSVTKLAGNNLSEWGSLPVIPNASPNSTSSVRKLRRFSVSPSSSIVDVNVECTHYENKLITECIPEVAGYSKKKENASPNRPKSLAIGNPLRPAEAGTSEISNIPKPAILTPTRADYLKMNLENVTTPVSSVNPSVENIDNICKSVINDLLNYVEYEEKSRIERKASILLSNPFIGKFDGEKTGMRHSASSPALRDPSTPSRVLEISEELESGLSDAEIVSSVVRGLVRDVLQFEKHQLRSTLERRRRNKTSARNSPV